MELLIAEVEFALPTLTGFTDDQLNYESHQEALQLVQENVNKMNRYMELCTQVEQKLGETAGEALHKSTTETFKAHGAKLYEVRRGIMKKSPAQPVSAEPRI